MENAVGPKGLSKSFTLKNIFDFLNLNKKIISKSQLKRDLKFDQSLFKIFSKLNSGSHQSDIFDFAYVILRPHIPFDRLGIALLDDNKQFLTLKWARSEYPITQIKPGYSTSITSSSLSAILKTKQPRIIAHLGVYLKEHPTSRDTKAILIDGMKSSLTFPLVIGHEAIGIIFFSSRKANTYSNEHIDIFSRVAEQLSLVITQFQLIEKVGVVKDKELVFRTTIHDLRSPLGIIESYLDLLNEELPEKERSHEISLAIETIKRNCLSMKILLNDLAELQSIKSLQANLAKTSMPLFELLSAALHTQSENAGKKNIELSLQDVSSPAIQVEVDKAKIARVLDNLLNNAIKFSKNGTKVSLRAVKKQDLVEISIIDQGLGIRSDEIKNLFKEYGKTSTRPTNGESSTGLGLFICKQIIEAHEGKIWAHSELGQGTTFTFTLPITKSTVAE